MSSEQCRSCRFWFRDEDTEQTHIGHCRRFPPVMVGEVLAHSAVDVGSTPTDEAFDPVAWYFPITFEDQWCGEYQRE